MSTSARIELRVVPGATRPGLVGRHGDSWKIRVSAPPEEGRANQAVIQLLAETLGVRRQDIAIVAGHGSRDKVVSLDGISADELDARLSSAVGGGAAR